MQIIGGGGREREREIAIDANTLLSSDFKPLKEG